MIKEQRSAVDVFLELLDARAPAASRNPLLDEAIGDKPRLIVLTKMDLADPDVTARWKRFFELVPQVKVQPVASLTRQNTAQVVQACIDLALAAKPKLSGTVRGMIVGIPNVGKSSLINAIAKSQKAGVAPKPGHTKGPKVIRCSERFELVDTPGMLWHKFEDMKVGHRLAMLGAIKDDVFDFYTLSLMTVEYLAAHYPGALLAKYKLEELPPDPSQLLEAIARRRGFIVKGGGVDVERACTLVMADFRTGGLGRMSLEQP